MAGEDADPITRATALEGMWRYPPGATSRVRRARRMADRCVRHGQVMIRRGLELSSSTGSLGTMDDVVIEVGGLRRSYGDFEAVRGLSLRIPRGELFALLGTNGAGKTTTIEVLEGLQSAESGCSG